MREVNTAINRMQFLRGDYSGKETPIRPPWAVDEFLFTSICNTCGDCIRQCPTRIIHKGRGGHPVIDFNAGECLLCGECADVCKPDALTIIEDRRPWSVIAAINTENCITFKGVECRSCYDPCDSNSITMTPRLGGVAIPSLDTDSCTGCGACFNRCPAKAIEMNTNQRLELR